jgi:hypothetical protein
MMENGKTEKNMEKELLYMLIVHDTKDNFKKAIKMDKEKLHTLLIIIMKENGKMTKNVVMV